MTERVWRVGRGCVRAPTVCPDVQMCRMQLRSVCNYASPLILSHFYLIYQGKGSPLPLPWWWALRGQIGYPLGIYHPFPRQP